MIMQTFTIQLTPADRAWWDSIPEAPKAYCENCGTSREPLALVTVARSYDPRKSEYMLCPRCQVREWTPQAIARWVADLQVQELEQLATLPDRRAA